LKSAYQLKLIEYKDKWLEMVKDRNLIAHLYKEAQAKNLYNKLPNYLKLFKNLEVSLENGD